MGISALGAGAWYAGAGAGFVGGFLNTGARTDWDVGLMLRAGGIGALSGFVGGGVGSAIGGGPGAFFGGVAADVTGQALSGNGVDLGRSLLSGGVSFGIYHGMSYASYKWGGGQESFSGRKLSYRQFAKINTAYQRSGFWKKEHGVYLNNDGSARFAGRSERGKFEVNFGKFQKGDFGTAHTHWAKGGAKYTYYDNKWHQGGGSNVPAGVSYREITASASDFSPGDTKNLIGQSFVVGRAGAYYMIQGAQSVKIMPDPFVRLFIIPF